MSPSGPSPAPSKRPAMRGGHLMLYTSIAIQASALLRNVVVARVLGPHEFGLAATIILAVAFLDALSNSGTQNLLVQAKEDDNGKLLASAHAVFATRGVATALLILAAAIPLAGMFDLGLNPWALGLVAFAPLIAGFAHRGVKSVQRDGDLRPDSYSQLASEVANLAVTIPVAMYTHSHVAIVAGLIARSAVNVIVTHALVKLPYQIRWTRDEMVRLWAFSWPLLINGPLVFISAQADRLVVTSAFGPAALGVYSAVMVLVMSPSNAIQKWLGTVYFPVLSRHYHEHGNLADRGPVFRYGAATVALGWLMCVGFTCFGATIVSVLYGPKYHTPMIVIALIGILQVIRFLRGWPSLLSLSVAATAGILVATVVRLAVLPLAFVGVHLVGDLAGLIAGLIAGEIVAQLVSLMIANRNANRPAIAGVPTFTVFVAAILGVLALQVTLGGGLFYEIPLFVVAALLGVPALAATLSVPQTARLAQQAMGRLRSFAGRR